MKQTFSNRYFDWILMGISLIFLLKGMIHLFSGFKYLSIYLLRTALFLASALAFYSLVSGKINGERFARFFLIVVLIIPGILFLNQILTDLIFYGINRLDLLQSSTFFLQLIAGIMLLYFGTKFSKQQESDRIKDYGLLIIGIGIFAILCTLIRAIEPGFAGEQMSYPIWKTVVKFILAMLTLIAGVRIKDEKLKFSRGVIWILVLMLVFGWL